MFSEEILLVEDNPFDAEFAITALREVLKNEIVHLENGELAMDYLYKKGNYKNRRGQLPRLILLDLKMPKVNGIEVLRMVKGDKALRKVPVVMLTSSREPSDIQTCYDLNANAYVSKPVDANDFLEAVKSVGNFWARYNINEQ